MHKRDRKWAWQPKNFRMHFVRQWLNPPFLSFYIRHWALIYVFNVVKVTANVWPTLVLCTSAGGKKELLPMKVEKHKTHVDLAINVWLIEKKFSWKWLREDFVQKLYNEEDTVKTLLALHGSDNSTSTGIYWHRATPSPTTPVALISSIHSPVHFSPNLYNFSPTYNARNLPLNSLN